MNAKINLSSPSLQFEEINQQTLRLLIATRDYSLYMFSRKLKFCRNIRDRSYLLRENARVTEFLANTLCWLENQQWDQGSETTKDSFENPPNYFPERTDLDNLLPSEFIGIRHRILQLSDRLNNVTAVAA